MPNSRKSRLIMVKQGWDPEDTIKGDLFASMIAERGYDVEVVTNFPHYPGSSLYPGWRMRLLHRELRGETSSPIVVNRVLMYPSHDRNPLKRLLNYASFSFSAFIYLMTRPRFDVIYAYHPPITTALAALTAGLIRRVPVVLDVQDIWPDTLRATGMLNNTLALRIIDKVCRWSWRRASALAVNSGGFRRLLIDRGVDPARVRVAYNWADEDSLCAGRGLPMPKEIASSGAFTVLAAGNMGPAQGLDTIVDAARLAPEIRFILIGDGIDRERLTNIAEELPNLEVYPRVPMTEVGAWLNAADALLVHLIDDPLFAITIPSRIQTYMAAGRPILLGVTGEAAELVKASECGLCFKSSDAAALAECARRMASLTKSERDAMGRAGRSFYERHLSLRAGIDTFVSLFEHCTRVRTFGP